MYVEIDKNSGFCFGVVRAISKAEAALKELGGEVYSLGDIVHNRMEVQRLEALGLRTITHSDMEQLGGHDLFIRAHGEPRSTYQLLEGAGLGYTDATCPVVLHLQERIKREYDADTSKQKQIVIFGKNGHAEVLGLVGQTEGTAIVIESPEEVERLDMNRDICLYSQTTKSLDGFRTIVEYIQNHISPDATFKYADTICRQVANRMPHIREFASRHDVILFVCGKKSSNGRVLFSQCKEVNPHSYMIDTASEVDPSWLQDCSSVGICGATSTPKWLMEQCRDAIETLET